MFQTTIVNPQTGRSIQVKGWKINATRLYEDLRAGALTAKSLSWSLLSDDASYQEMIETEDEDSARGNWEARDNWALSIFENALDWAIGLKILRFIEALAREHRKARDFEVLVSRSGNVYIRLPKSGAVL